MQSKHSNSLSNPLKQQLANGQVALSLTVRLVRSVEIAALAKAAGFDSLYVDMEHSSLSLEATTQICLASAAVGVTPLVRVGQLMHVPSVLDGGAMGVILPHVESAKDAQAVVDAAKFPPLGQRSIPGALMPQFGYRSVPADTMAQELNDSTLVVVMIESVSALANVDEIAAVEGVDMIFIGTNDLCASMGIAGQLDHPWIRNAYEKCLSACKVHGKYLGVGGLNSRPEAISKLIEKGAGYISVGTDIAFLLAGAKEKSYQLRESISQFHRDSSTPKQTETAVAKAYWINTYREIKNEAALAEYGKLAGPAIQAGGGRFIARGLPNVIYESGMNQRTILIEFDSLEQAVATHDGPAYQAALQALGDGAIRDIRIIEAA